MYSEDNSQLPTDSIMILKTLSSTEQATATKATSRRTEAFILMKPYIRVINIQSGFEKLNWCEM